MQGPLPVAPGLVVPAAELSWRFSKASGPGGQGVNTTDSRVELSLDVAGSGAFSETQRRRALERLGPRLSGGVLTVVASEHRSQRRNREAARTRLIALLRDAVAPPGRSRRPTRPTLGSHRRRLEAKQQRGRTKALRGRVDPE